MLAEAREVAQKASALSETDMPISISDSVWRAYADVYPQDIEVGIQDTRVLIIARGIELRRRTVNTLKALANVASM